MKKALIIVCVLVVIIVGAGVFSNTLGTKLSDKDKSPIQTTNPPKGQVMCTMEAKLCPDGSYVGRTGPNCEFTQCPNTQPQVSTGTKTSINKKILSGGVYITPLKVVEDSRCPTDVNCIWAGTVRLLVKFEVSGKVNEVTMSLGDSTSWGDKRITFVSVSPAQNSKKQIAGGDYVFTFKVDGTAAASEGTLKGHMTIGPICPVEHIDNPCKPSPEMYAAHKIYVYASSSKQTLVKTITADANGDFSTALAVGSYYVDTDNQGVGGDRGVPTTIKIVSGGVVTLDIDVDTGIR